MAININIPSQFREYNNFASFPATGDSKVVYVAKNNNKIYRWDGAAYVELSTDAASSWGSIQGTLSNQTDLQTALNAKENTITAGTTSQYFRGDKTFQTLDKAAVGLGNVDNTSDANKPISTATQTALNAKQDTLTLTTTGTSGAATLVGATLNIPQYGGGSSSGLQGSQIQFNNTQGQATFGFNAALTAANGGTVIPTASRLDVYPVTPNKTFTNVSLTINVATLGVGALARLVVYSDSNSFPTTKLYESADIDCSTTGEKTVLTGLTFTAGTTYWLGFYSNGIATFRTIVASQMLPIFAPSSSTLTVAWSRISTTLGTAPTTFNYNTSSSANQINIIIKQV